VVSLYQNVLWFDVAMDYAFAMSEGEGICNVTKNCHCLAKRQGIVFIESGPKRRSMHVRHGVVKKAVVRSR